VGAFAEGLLDAFNGGALAILISIGHRTGLFDAMAAGGPATSDRLAATAGLDERYVREWLGGLTASGVVVCDPQSGTYALPDEHAAVLTSAAAPENLAVFAQYIPLMGKVEDDILECFRNGGGVPYEKYDRFHEVMAEDSGQTVVAALHDRILPLVPTITDRLARGIRVLDVGCGRGLALMSMAERYPESFFVGFELSQEAVDWAWREASSRGLTNIRFEQRDLSDFDITATPETFDLITAFDAIHDQARPASVLTGIFRSLKPGGWFLMQDIRGSSHHHLDIGHPAGTLLYTVSLMHCMTVSLAQGGEGLGAMWGEERTLEYLGNAGFDQVDVRQLDHDFQNNFYVSSK
jgi:2-polyprenyl-3-methyl-5-hydroxy-6-metoxy-1,4-benzoquinol methylase